MSRHGAVAIPAVVAALPFCGENRSDWQEAERRQRREAFLYDPRFSPVAD